jgi:hypothetical protein
MADADERTARAVVPIAEGIVCWARRAAAHVERAGALENID